MATLNKRTVDAIQPAARDIVLWDDALAGFGVRVKPSGVRTYIVQYRNAHGRSRRHTLGRHGPLAPDSARRLARQVLGQIAGGADPRPTARRSARFSHSPSSPIAT